ncbi:DNA-binding response regulator, NarL/FixJ family, contains REC and HTH domains [Paenibacillus sp. UNCCL117]|uniref:response regulator transcription factor n=1 Tax=unclassified Paenibacillus TaxID=185978 RepID=UPI0008825F09|nr:MULTISPECIES: response regulator transcription factor [unclassified Paenibacillus]SDE65916.1 DNA-binding response regulator, NarL/FixJ family, contains REC and HTH domains [Paenibacillus sp. cl123]SFW70358.1 DNA-binding response regulator, NarL/FixJ family, contains REC and HTH domains [Paenibacillus sp. UNCCL117]
MPRILIADDQRLLRDGLETILSLEEDFEVVGVAENGLQALDMMAEHRPDIVLMDIKMPVMDGIEAMKRIKRDYPDTVVIMLTTFPEDKYIVEAMSGGAEGFLLKDMPADRVIQTVRDAVVGQLMIPASIASKLASQLMILSNVRADPFDENRLKDEGLMFTERERKIILLMIEGCSNKQISSALYMGEGTVRNYISVIYNKIGTNDRQSAIARLKDMLLS